MQVWPLRRRRCTVQRGRVFEGFGFKVWGLGFRVQSLCVSIQRLQCPVAKCMPQTLNIGFRIMLWEFSFRTFGASVFVFRMCSALEQQFRAKSAGHPMVGV